MAKTQMPQNPQETARPLQESEPLFSLLNAISEDDLPKTMSQLQKAETVLSPSSVIAKKKKLSAGTVFGGVYLSPKPNKYCHFCGAVKTPQWRRGPDKQHSLCNACGLRFLTMVQKEAKVMHDSTLQRVAVCSLVNPPKSTSSVALPLSGHAVALNKPSEPFCRIPTKDMARAASTPMVSATKTTTMRFAWNPPAETLRATKLPPGYAPPALANPYIRGNTW